MQVSMNILYPASRHFVAASVICFPPICVLNGFLAIVWETYKDTRGTSPTPDQSDQGEAPVVAQDRCP
jgi:hypothetical protein